MSGQEKLLTDQPELLQQFGMDLLPVLIQIYGSSVNAPVRHKCLSAIGKLFYFSSVDMIQSLLGATNISRSNTNHDHDQPAHLRLRDPQIPELVNLPKYGGPES